MLFVKAHRLPRNRVNLSSRFQFTPSVVSSCCCAFSVPSSESPSIPSGHCRTKSMNPNIVPVQFSDGRAWAYGGPLGVLLPTLGWRGAFFRCSFYCLRYRNAWRSRPFLDRAQAIKFSSGVKTTCGAGSFLDTRSPQWTISGPWLWIGVATLEAFGGSGCWSPYGLYVNSSH
jgi:hypothetical protein